MKTHPLAKIQFFLALVWAVLAIISSYSQVTVQSVFFWISLAPLIALSVITIRLGWLIVFHEEMVIYPQEGLNLWFFRAIGRPEAARRWEERYQRPGRMKLLGVMNLLSGVVCLILALAFAVYMVVAP